MGLLKCLKRVISWIYEFIKDFFPRYYIQMQGIRYLLLLFVVIYCGIVSQGVETKSIPGTIHTDYETGAKDDNYLTLYFGLSQQGKCIDNNPNKHHYFVQSRKLSNGQVDPNNDPNSKTLSTPVVYYDGNISCIDDEQFGLCHNIFSSPAYQQSLETFALNFDINKINHEYFPYIRWAVNLSILSIFIIAAHGVTQLRYNKFALSFFNELIGFFILSFIIQSIFHTQLMFAEDCLDILKPSITLLPKTEYCSLITSCGLQVATVLDLNDNVALYYFQVLGYFSIIWFTFISAHFICFIVYFLHLRTLYFTEELHRSILSRTGDDLLQHLEQAPKEFVDIYIADWNYIYNSDHSDNVNNIDLSQVESSTTSVTSPLHSQQVSSVTLRQPNDTNICSICLGSLMESPFSTSDIAMSSSSGSSGTSAAAGSSIRSHINNRFDSIGSYINHILSRLFAPWSWSSSTSSSLSSNSTSATGRNSIRGRHTRLPTDANDSMPNDHDAVADATSNTLPESLSSDDQELQHTECKNTHQGSSSSLQRSRNMLSSFGNTLASTATAVITTVASTSSAAGPNGVPGSRNTVCPVCRDPLNPNRVEDTFGGDASTLLLM